MTNRRIYAVLLLTTLATIGCDRVTKEVATTTLEGLPVQSFWGDTVRLELTANTGAFLGLGADWPEPARMAVLVVGTGLLLAAMVVAAVCFRWNGAARLGVAFVAAGGMSNLFDRIAYGSVVDFMNVGLGSLRTGIFNLADVAIMAGVALVASGGQWSKDR
jgi:signal peptidase II